MTLNAGEFIAQLLKQEGLDRMFVLTGGDHHLWIALADCDVRPMLARSEASAIYMADAYAQRSGNIGLSYGQGGPGAANVAAALADPYWSRTPLITLNGANPESSNYRQQYQDLDTDPMLRQVTANNFRISSAAQLVTLLPRAIALARLNGPVNISIPRDLFGKPVGDVSWPVTIPELGGRAAPDAAAIAAAVEAIRAMRRPIILGGTGAKRARVGDMLLQLARRVGGTIATSAGGKGVVSETDELVTGVIGRYAGKASVATASEADGFIVFGSRLGGLVTDGFRFPANGGAIVQFDRDAESLMLHPGPGVRVQTDLELGLSALLEQLRDHEPAEETSAWQRQTIERRTAWRDTVAGLPIYGESDELRPHAVFPALNRLAERITLVADTGYMAAWACTLFDVADPDGFFRANGSLGWGYPAALGVQSADPSRRVVCLSGDGGIGYHIGDFETAIRLALPVIVVVLNNRGLAFEYHGQKYKFDNRIVPAVNDLTDLDHSAVARGFGWQGRRVRRLEEFETALDEALADSASPWLIDVVIDREDFAPITNYDGVLERTI